MAKGKKNPVSKEVSNTLPEIIGEARGSAGYGRLGRSSGVNTPDDKVRLNNLANYDNGYSTNTAGYIVNRDPVLLCRNAYKRFPAFTTAINILTDISNTDIQLQGGNSQANKFIEALFRRVNMWDVKEQFFRECYLSGSIFFQRFDVELNPSDIARMGQIYSTKESLAKKIALPGKYVLLDSANIGIQNMAYGQPTYCRILSKFELESMKDSGDKETKEAYVSIRKSIDKYASGTGNGEPMIPIDPSKLHVIFYQKQDYEPFATPMGYCVLDDINLKLEFRKMDAVLARCTEYSILLVTAGEKQSEGGVDPVVMAALKSQFKNDKIGRVLVADYTTEVDFKVPEIGDLLSPTKYDDLNASISGGLMNIFFGEQKFADSVNKLRAISKKAENAQNLFLTKFLNPEIKRISKIMGFKNYPTAVMEPVRIEDQTNMVRIYAQLMQMGILSPKDGLELMNTGIIPDYDSVELNQQSFKVARDKGLFQPMQNNNQEGEAGRPSGTKSPQTTKKVSQVGANDSFSQRLLVDNTKKFYALKSSFTAAYKQKFGLKKLTADAKSDIQTKLLILCKSETPESWAARLDEYLEPSAEKLAITDADYAIARISAEYEISTEDATVLYHSQAK